MNWKHHINIIALDADDTLWVNEPLFQKTQHTFKEILRPYVELSDLDARLYATEKKNLKFFGYGVKGFILSMIETAIEITEQKIRAADLQHIIDLGKSMLLHPVELLEGVEEAVKSLSKTHELMVITKGDLFDQESKIARSGLAQYFSKIEVVSEKDKATYQDVLLRHGIALKEFVMVGNSLKSDVLPICELGGHAIHVPYSTTWVHETLRTQQAEQIDYLELANLGELVDFFKP